jgi:YHS domain-containing protein
MGNFINADPISRIALQAYDPVTFHTASKATKASPFISSEYSGYKYLFSSQATKATFEENPEKYLPAYGGFCAFGVANGVCSPVEIDTWEIIDGRLVLQYSNEFKQKFGEHRDENIRKANDHWSRITEEKTNKLELQNICDA